MTRERKRLVRGLLASAVLVVGCSVAIATRSEATPLVRTVTVGHAPYWTLALDEHTGHAFVFNRQDGTLSVLDTRTGALLHTVTLAPGNVWLAVATQTGRVFVSGYETGTITTLDARSGAVLRRVVDGTDVQIAVDARSNQVFVASTAGLAVLDARSGTLTRHLPTCAPAWAVGVSERTGHVFVKCNDATMEMLDARTGHVVRRVPDHSGSYGGLLVDERTNRVFVGPGNAPDIDMLDAQTGASVRSIAIDPSTFPTVDERTGHVYLGLGDANTVTPPPHKSEVVMLDGRTGGILRRVPVATNPFSLAVDPQTGHVLVGSVGPLDGASDLPTGNGTLTVLDAVRGRVLRTMQIGASPSDIAIDARDDRVLVVNSYSDTHGKGALKTWHPHESWWPQVLRRVKQVICCLPFQASSPPAPTTNGTVTTLDLSRL